MRRKRRLTRRSESPRRLRPRDRSHGGRALRRRLRCFQFRDWDGARPKPLSGRTNQSGDPREDGREGHYHQQASRDPDARKGKNRSPLPTPRATPTPLQRNLGWPCKLAWTGCPVGRSHGGGGAVVANPGACRGRPAGNLIITRELIIENDEVASLSRVSDWLQVHHSPPASLCPSPLDDIARLPSEARHQCSAHR
jgi:hypothetical protein